MPYPMPVCVCVCVCVCACACVFEERVREKRERKDWETACPSSQGSIINQTDISKINSSSQ